MSGQLNTAIWPLGAVTDGIALFGTAPIHAGAHRFRLEQTSTGNQPLTFDLLDEDSYHRSRGYRVIARTPRTLFKRGEGDLDSLLHWADARIRTSTGGQRLAWWETGYTVEQDASSWAISGSAIALWAAEPERTQELRSAIERFRCPERQCAALFDRPDGSTLPCTSDTPLPHREHTTEDPSAGGASFIRWTTVQLVAADVAAGGFTH